MGTTNSDTSSNSNNLFTDLTAEESETVSGGCYYRPVVYYYYRPYSWCYRPCYYYY